MIGRLYLTLTCLKQRRGGIMTDVNGAEACR